MQLLLYSWYVRHAYYSTIYGYFAQLTWCQGLSLLSLYVQLLPKGPVIKNVPGSFLDLFFCGVSPLHGLEKRAFSHASA